MPHNHHKHGCEHANIAYCGHCDTAYCKGCNREWGKYTVTYTSPSWRYPYYTNVLGSAAGTVCDTTLTNGGGALGSNAISGTLSLCSHGSEA